MYIRTQRALAVGVSELGDKLDTMDFISFKYPNLEVADTEENINMLVEHLKANGFEVLCSRK